MISSCLRDHGDAPARSAIAFANAGLQAELAK